MLKESARILSCAMIAASLHLTSCDEKYDLSKDINTDILIGSQFKVPVGHTDTIYVNRVIEESETITDNNGIYEVSTNGNTSTTVGPLDEVSVNNFTPAFGNVIIGIDESGNVPNGTIVEAGKVNSIGTYDIYEQLPEEVVALYNADFKGGSVHTMLEITLPPVPDAVKNVSFRDLTMTFPEFVKLENGTNSFKITELNLDANNSNVILDIYVESFSISKDMQNKYIVTGENGRKYLKITDDVEITAYASVSLGGNVKPQNIEVAFEYYMEKEKASINQVAGKFNTSANISTDIALNDIPDFLRNGNTSFEPQEVYVYIDLLNPLNAAGSFLLDMTSIKGSQTSSASTNIEVEADMMNNILISSLDTFVAGYTTVVNKEIANLFRFVPDNISITSDNLTLESMNNMQMIKLGEEYTLTADYHAIIPFKFSNMNIEYTDNIDNLLSDLEDVADKTDRLIVRAVGVTNIPVDLEATVSLYDIDGHQLNGIDVNLDKFRFSAATNDAESTNELEIILTEKDGSDDLERLEKIVYTIYASSIDGITLKPKQYLVIKDILVEIPDGIKLTL